MPGVIKRTGPVAHLSARSGEQRAIVFLVVVFFHRLRAEHRVVKFLGAHRSNHGENDIATILDELSFVEQLSIASPLPANVVLAPRVIKAKSADGRLPYTRDGVSFYKGTFLRVLLIIISRSL